MFYLHGNTITCPEVSACAEKTQREAEIFKGQKSQLQKQLTLNEYHEQMFIKMLKRKRLNFWKSMSDLFQEEIENLGQVWWCTLFIPPFGRRSSDSMRPVWPTYLVPGHPEIHDRDPV